MRSGERKYLTERQIRRTKGAIPGDRYKDKKKGGSFKLKAILDERVDRARDTDT